MTRGTPAAAGRALRVLVDRYWRRRFAWLFSSLLLTYTVPYAVGNILLTAWGPVIVALLR